MKKVILLFVLNLFLLNLSADNVIFTIRNGATGVLKERIEEGVSTLLSHLDDGDFSNVMFDGKGGASFNRLWSRYQFSCMETNIETECHTLSTGYEVREINIQLTKVPKGYDKQMQRELVICFSPKGEITDVHFALQQHQYKYVMESGDNHIEESRSLQLNNFVEMFRSLYEEMDADAIENLFDDQALIITGRVIYKRKIGDIAKMDKDYELHRQTKQEYMRNLRKLFKRNKYVKLSFSQIELGRDTRTDDMYWVRLKQNWNTERYMDYGTLFLLCQFLEDNTFIIHVRTWVPFVDDPEDYEELKPSYYDIE